MARPRAALYHRVSTVDQRPDAARSELRDAAKRYGFRVTLDVEETGSGANNDRPGLVRVLEAARRGQVAAVLVWNTVYMQAVIDRLIEEGLIDRSHLSPCLFAHVNPYGRYRFDVDRVDPERLRPLRAPT